MATDPTLIWILTSSLQIFDVHSNQSLLNSIKLASFKQLIQPLLKLILIKLSLKIATLLMSELLPIKVKPTKDLLI